MIKLLKNAIEYIVIGIALFGAIIVWATLRRGNFNGYIFGTGILLIVIPILVYWIVVKVKDKTGPQVKLLRDLKQTGIRVPVDLTKCFVKSNHWISEVERYDSPRVSFLNEISGDSDKNIERVETNLSRIEYSCDFGGKHRTFFSPAVAKDKITLTLLMEMQKETAIYVDRDDAKYYYFDLEFIDS